jgi:surfeit locus 1 family protein
MIQPAMNRRASASLPLRLALLGLAALVCAAFVGLGLWQADRAGQKSAMLDAFAQALAAEPVALEQALAAGGKLPRRVHGRLQPRDDLPWLLLDNQRRGAAVGVRAYLLAEPQRADQEQADQELASAPLLLVELGWLPLPADRRLPELPAMPAQIDIDDGLLLAPPSVGLRFVTHRIEAQPGRVLLTYLDPLELGRDLGRELHPRVLRPDPTQPIGFARDLELLPNTITPEQHRGYALQWFGLAIAVAVIALVLLIRSRRR